MASTIGNARASWINYRKPGIFMITMTAEDGVPPFSQIRTVDEGNKPMVYANPLEIGVTIRIHISRLKKLCPGLEGSCIEIMPDHVHFLVFIKQLLPRDLGKYLASMKRNIYLECREKNLVAPGIERIFQRGFNDQFLKKSRNLNQLKNYIRENPYRLWVRKEHPECRAQLHN